MLGIQNYEDLLAFITLKETFQNVIRFTKGRIIRLSQNN
jgi:hypothetical protein